MTSKPRLRSSDKSFFVQQHIVGVARHPQPGEIGREVAENAF